MAAYAALVSLTNILDQILHPPPAHHFIIPRDLIESLREKVDWLIDFLETYSRSSKEYENLERRIADAAYDAEDLIESDVVSQIRANSAVCGEKSSHLLCQGLKRAIKKLESMEKKLAKIKDRKAIRNLQLENPVTTSSPRPLSSRKNTMVGFDKHLIQIKSALATDEPSLQIIPIVGMGGIGKTTLATNVYNDRFMIEHFDIHAWVTISQEYTVRELLLRLLHQISGLKGMENLATFSANMSGTSDDQLGVLLYQELFDRRYLVVMDDMWNIQAWKKIKKFFPDNYNGSGILVTTRLLNLAVDSGSCRPYEMDFLDEKQSWDLLREKVFANEGYPREPKETTLDFGSCRPYEMDFLDEDQSWDLLPETRFANEGYPFELEKIGKRIAKRCRGLPLALVVIGGVLAKAKRTREHWEYVERNVISVINYEDDGQCTKILSLSYNHLPIYLKPYFLYLAVFAEDFEIPVSKLVRLWVAEGFIKPTSAKSLEEVARAYLEDLIDRNLILVGERGSNGKVKTIKIHDLLRDLCQRKAQEDKFLRVANLNNPNISPYLKSERRISILYSWRRKDLCRALRSAAVNRSVFSYFKWNSEWTVRSFSLLRVLDVVDRYTIDEIVKLINLRYVACTAYWDVCSTYPSTSRLWNLQTLVLDGETPLRVAIWQMPQLRHLKIRRLYIDHPPSAQMDGEDIIVLGNMQTLSRVCNFRCTEQVVERIPNLKKLGIAYNSIASDIMGPYYLNNLVHLHKLESLRIIGDQRIWGDITFPTSLKKLILSDCKIPWEDMSMFGSLPNLEVLKLHSHAAKGLEWNPVEGEFCRLKYLMIDECDLKIWGADNTHFPSLEHLTLEDVRLKEILISFAEILTLQVIEIHKLHRSLLTWNAPSLRRSAMEISEQRESFGYEGLQVLYLL